MNRPLPGVAEPADGETGAGGEDDISIDDRGQASPLPRLRWWREVLVIATFYFLYSVVHDIRGTKPVSATLAYKDAKRIISLERAIGIFHESWLQQRFLGAHWLIKLLDLYYGSLHFVLTAGMLAFLFFKVPERYRLWRNTLAAATALAIIGFATFPLMPPRLLPPSYHFVDTLRTIGGLWNFNSGPMTTVSDQLAAMPSLHTAWSAWCGWALASSVKHWWAKVVGVLYPLATVFTIVVTGNHYFLDAVGGLVTLGVGYLVGKRLTSYRLARIWTRIRRRVVARSSGGPAR